MTNVVPLRPAVRPAARARPARPALVPVRVDWDDARGLYVAACERCCEFATTERLDQADAWADTHRCDPELAALLSGVLRGIAA